MKKFAIQISILILVLFSALFVAYNRNVVNNILPTNPALNQKQIKVGEKQFSVELAQTESERSKGLGGRTSLKPDTGMLFVFPEAKKYQFWMKGMKIPLDFIFIKEGRVVDILPNIKPPKEGAKDGDLPIYEPTVPIDMVLELNAGTIESKNILIGDQVFLVQ